MIATPSPVHVEVVDCTVCNDAPALHCETCGAQHRNAIWDDEAGVYRMRRHGECTCEAWSDSECACGGCWEQSADAEADRINAVVEQIAAYLESRSNRNYHGDPYINGDWLEAAAEVRAGKWKP